MAFPTIQAEDYDFGQYSIYNTDSISAKLQIQNTSLYKDLIIYKYLVINKTTFTNDLPAIDSLNPITIKPNGNYEYNVSFKPEEVNEYKGKIIFYSNSKYSDNVANLKGEGIDTTTSVVEEINGTKLTIIIYNQSLFKVVVKETNASNISINIYNINGTLLMNRTGNITSGLNNFELDISKLISGIYLYNINLDGVLMKTGKFSIIR